jgi:hypothetical protein
MGSFLNIIISSLIYIYLPILFIILIIIQVVKKFVRINP